MKEYQVLFYHYEFKTKPDQTWGANDVIEAFNNQVDYDSYDSYVADNESDAEQMVEEYMANHMVEPRIEKTNVGYVVVGEVLEIIETTNDEITYSNLYTKGMEDKGE